MLNYLIDKNHVTELKTVPKDLEKNWVNYTWYNDKWEKIAIYDLENSKLAPIVRYLIEWEGAGRNWKLIIIMTLIWIVILSGLLYWFLSIWNDNNNKVQPRVNNIIQKPIEDKKVVQQIEQDTWSTIKDNTNELQNEVDLYKWLKNDAELEATRVNYLLQEDKFKIDNLNAKINNLQENNKDLTDKNIILSQKVDNYEKIIEQYKNDAFKSPIKSFIEYLWQMVYDNCESTKNEEKKANCQSLYYNFLKYVWNGE